MSSLNKCNPIQFVLRYPYVSLSYMSNKEILFIDVIRSNRKVLYGTNVSE